MQAQTPNTHQTTAVNSPQSGGSVFSCSTDSSLTQLRGDSRIARTALVEIPVTHSVAGFTVPVSKSFQRRFGASAYAIDEQLVSEIDQVVSVLEIGLQEQWVNDSSVGHMLTNYPCGSPEQSHACFDLLNECFDKIIEEKLLIDDLFKRQLVPFAFDLKEIGWQHSFTFSFDDQLKEFEDISWPEVTNTGFLVARRYDLYAISFDFLTKDIAQCMDILQLVHFCSALSLHRTSLDLILDESMRWRLLGGLDELEDEQCEELILRSDDEQGFKDYLIQAFGEEFIDEYMFDSIHIPMEFFKYYGKAKSLDSNLLPFTATNVAEFAKNISQKETAPAWLKTAYQLLNTYCCWSVDMNSIIEEGHLSAGAMMPIGLGFSIEEDLFSMIHHSSMEGNESGFFCLPINADTPALLANLELGESLLLFVHTMMEEITNG